MAAPVKSPMHVPHHVGRMARAPLAIRRMGFVLAISILDT
jgi:hypothetical protein